MTAPHLVFRVQDADGRGPFKPGFSATWADDVRDFSMLPWFQEFGLYILERAPPDVVYFGSACRTEAQLRKWFSDAELNRLFLSGHRVVQIEADAILAESAIQLVFGCRKPIRDCVKP